MILEVLRLFVYLFLTTYYLYLTTTSREVFQNILESKNENDFVIVSILFFLID